jgi:HEAT repeat protein
MDIVEQLIKDLQDEWKCRDALRELAIHGDHRAVWPIIEMFGQILDPDSRQVELTRDALIHIGDESIEPLVRSLDHWNPALRELACETLSEIGNKRAVHELGAVMLKDPHAMVAKAATRAIGKIGGEASLLLLMRALKHPNEDVQRIAIAYLGTMGDARAIEALVDYLSARDQDLISRVKKSLEQLGYGRSSSES